MKRPEDCSTIEEIRAEIDLIDKQLLNLLGERLKFVKSIVRFKNDEEDVLARERYEQVLEERRSWAVQNGLDPDVIEDLYKSMISYFIDVQKKALKARLTHQAAPKL
jgi:isochorismate pyruvate lyase